MNSTERVGSEMKTGDIVPFMGKLYRVGRNMTDVSVELVELKHPLRGLWVSRDAVSREASSEVGQLFSE